MGHCDDSVYDEDDDRFLMERTGEDIKVMENRLKEIDNLLFNKEVTLSEEEREEMEEEREDLLCAFF